MNQDAGTLDWHTRRYYYRKAAQAAGFILLSALAVFAYSKAKSAQTDVAASDIGSCVHSTTGFQGESFDRHPETLRCPFSVGEQASDDLEELEFRIANVIQESLYVVVRAAPLAPEFRSPKQAHLMRVFGLDSKDSYKLIHQVTLESIHADLEAPTVRSHHEIKMIYKAATESEPTEILTTLKCVAQDDVLSCGLT